MPKQDLNGVMVRMSDRIHLYDTNNDYGVGTVIPGRGKSLVVVMDPGSALEGKHNLRDIETKGINYVVIGRKDPDPNTLEEEVYFTQKDLDNLNYLLSRGITGSIKRTTSQYSITITISKQ